MEYVCVCGWECGLGVGKVVSVRPKIRLNASTTTTLPTDLNPLLVCAGQGEAEGDARTVTNA